MIGLLGDLHIFLLVLWTVCYDRVVVFGLLSGLLFLSKSTSCCVYSGFFFVANTDVVLSRLVERNLYTLHCLRFDKKKISVKKK